MNPFIVVGEAKIPSFGLLQAVGLVLVLLFIRMQAKQFNISFEKLHWLTLIVCLGGAIGMRAAYLIQKSEPLTVQNMINMRSGTMSYGFIIGIVVGYFIYTRLASLRGVHYLDVCLPAWIVAQIVGRIACFFAGCCYGAPTQVPWSVTFARVYGTYPDGISRHPAVLYESIGVLAILCFLLFRQKRKRFDGEITCWYFLLYGCLRFFVEFFRGDPRGEIWGLSPAQSISIVFIALSVSVLVTRMDNRQKLTSIQN